MGKEQDEFRTHPAFPVLQWIYHPKAFHVVRKQPVGPLVSLAFVQGPARWSGYLVYPVGSR